MLRKGIFQFKSALTRQIDKSLPAMALRMDSQSNVNMAKATEQHGRLTEILQRDCGLEIQEIPSGGFPDSVFIEDTCVICDDTVFLTHPGDESRRGEVAAVGDHLKLHFSSPTRKFHTQQLGTLDGGDVMFNGYDEIFVGRTSRTDDVGMKMLEAAFHPMRVCQIDLSQFSHNLHLKSACSMCGPDHVLIGGEVGKVIQSQIEACSPGRYKFTYTPDTYASNVLFINNILVRRADSEFPNSVDALKSVGGSQIQVEASELAKVDGALTCTALFIA